MKYILPLLILVGISAPLTPAFADNDMLICAAVHPCNPDGSVMAPYNTGACAAKYAKECLSNVANKAILSCETSLSQSDAKVASLKKELDKTKRRLKAAQRNARR